MGPKSRRKTSKNGGRESSVEHIKRRNRNFDPELRILASRTRTGTESRGRSRSPVSKSIGDTSSIKDSKLPSDATMQQRLGKILTREPSQTFSIDSSSSDKDYSDDASSSGRSGKVVRFSLSPTRYDSCKDGKTGGLLDGDHLPHLTKEPTGLINPLREKLAKNKIPKSSTKARITQQNPALLPAKYRRLRASIAPIDDGISTETGGFLSPITVTQQSMKIGATNYLVEKVASVFRCGNFVVKEQDSYAISNATDLIHAASADQEEILSYIEKNKRSKRANSVLSKFPNVEAMVNSLTASSNSKSATETQTKKLSSSQQVKVQSLKANGDRHALCHKYKDAVKCYVLLVEIYMLEGLSCSDSDEGQAMTRVVQTLREHHHKYVTLANSDDIFRMGREQEAAGRFASAVNCYSVAFRIRRDVLETTRHPSFLLLLNAIGSLQTKRGLIEDAHSFLYLAQDIQNETKAGPISRALTERNIGASFEISSNYTDALLHYNESFRLHRESRGVTWNADAGKIGKTRGDDSNNNNRRKLLYELLLEPVHTAHRGHGIITPATAKEEGMEICMESSVNLYNVPPSEKVVGKEDILKEIDPDVDLAMTLHSIGRLLAQYFKSYLLASNAYTTSLYLMKKSLGSDHPNVAALLGSIGNICMEREAYDRALVLYESGLQIEEKKYGESHPEVAVTIFNIGTAELAQGNYVEAMTSFERAIKIQKAAFGADSALIGLALHGVGEVAERMNLMPKALRSYQAALKIDQVTLGKSHPKVGHTLHKMAKIQYRHLKNYDAAKRLCLIALNSYKSSSSHDRDALVIDLQRDLGNIKARMLTPHNW